ncbi:hypothetical protein K1719_042180 [Acacia pycnantha]|nr:hypothetical protein K1719_042180 [Acacia pycnantha]
MTVMKVKELRFGPLNFELFCPYNNWILTLIAYYLLLLDVVGLVTTVYGVSDVQVNGGTPAFWACINYSKVVVKDDVVVALICVKIERILGGETIFMSYCDLS